MLTDKEYDLIKTRYDKDGNRRIVCHTCKKDANVKCAILNHDIREVEMPLVIKDILDNLSQGEKQ